MKFDDAIAGYGRLFDFGGSYNNADLRRVAAAPPIDFIADAMRSDMEKLAMDVESVRKRMDREYGQGC